jgi:hypothetical protein
LGGGEVIVVLREGVYEDVVEGARRRSVCVCVCVCVCIVYLFFGRGVVVVVVVVVDLVVHSCC